jgi:periplasmic nitrate reductase NapE
MDDNDFESASDRKRKERRLFLFIILLFFPLLSVAIVGTYGFSIWMFQLIMGPPGPPG